MSNSAPSAQQTAEPEPFLYIELVGSICDASPKVLGTARSLGLRKVGDVALQPSSPELKGKLRRVAHVTSSRVVAHGEGIDGVNVRGYSIPDVGVVGRLFSASDGEYLRIESSRELVVVGWSSPQTLHAVVGSLPDERISEVADVSYQNDEMEIVTDTPVSVAFDLWSTRGMNIVMARLEAKTWALTWERKDRWNQVAIVSTGRVPAGLLAALIHRTASHQVASRNWMIVRALRAAQNRLRKT